MPTAGHVVSVEVCSIVVRILIYMYKPLHRLPRAGWSARAANEKSSSSIRSTPPCSTRSLPPLGALMSRPT